MDVPVNKPCQADLVVREPLNSDEDIDFRLIELLFFAYRDFTGDADVILERYGFGRAHHRVLHFVNRDPGMTIADLLDLLQITKQSLSRVLRQLIEGDFIALQPGTEDRRQRRLYPTSKGRALTLELSRAQVRRIDAARAACETARAGFDLASVSSFLFQMSVETASTRSWFDKKGIDGKADDEQR
ncbi:MarR family winged helix-turn-helix transcriptional regulator [Consotaella aegiceratis]|uniref:MarR family winged helix-turn-helix transcriptional regulator n=1 Tax=Consotaella aegiceratis TaxID=3097961 RepID=UPI002F40B784